MYFLTFFPMYRPTAYSVLIDLLHYLRDDLSHAQIARIIALFSKHINETGFSFSMQMICLKLLVNFVDRITHLPVKAEGVFILKVSLLRHLKLLVIARELLERILEALDVRLLALRLSLPSIVKYLKETATSPQVSAADSSASVASEDDSWHILKGYTDIGFVQPIRTATGFVEGSTDILKDAKRMFKSLSQCI
jgi:transformation/transcription domain-associated protein